MFSSRLDVNPSSDINNLFLYSSILTIFCHNVEQITTKNGLGTPIENWIEYPSLKEINNSPRTQIRCYEVKVVGNLGPLTEERDVVDISHCVRE